MAGPSPKRVIIEYYDSLINQIDIFAEEVLTKHSEDELIDNDQRVFAILDRHPENNENKDIFDENFCESKLYRNTYNKESEIEAKQPRYDMSKEAISIHKYVNEMRDEMIDKLRRIQDETLVNYERNLKDEMKETKLNDLESIKKKVFRDKFAFLFYPKIFGICNDKFVNRCPFGVYLVVLDYYLDNMTKTIFGYIAFHCFNYSSMVTDNVPLIFSPNYGFHIISMRHCLTQMIAKHLWSVFKSLVFGYHVIEACKSQIMSIKSVNFENHYPVQFAQLENVPEFEGVFDFTEIKSLGLLCHSSSQNTKCFYDFSGLSGLECLILNDGQPYFAHLNNLTKLYLLGCNMRNMKSDDFQSLPNLQFLQITQIKNNAHISFHHLHRLRRLNVFKAQSLNFLYRLPDEIQILKIESSDVNMLTNLRHENLRVVDISIYRAYSFDVQCLRGLTGLRHFRINKSLLNSIKLDYPFMANLETLSLEHNKIENIDLSQLVNLKSLNLSNNPKLILNRSTTAAQVDKLEELYLSGVSFSNNKLSAASLGQLKQLRILDLSDNKIRKFDPKMFIGLKNLRELDFSLNPVGKLEPKLVAKIFPRLEKLA